MGRPGSRVSAPPGDSARGLGGRGQGHGPTPPTWPAAPGGSRRPDGAGAGSRRDPGCGRRSGPGRTARP